ncbi:UNVERIFIED_CONTAM: hypothetical protein RMT77_006213 [Armadillidium vulgare]
MASTPTGIPPGRKRGHGYKLRRRIVELQNEDGNTEKESTPEQEQTDVAKSSLGEETSVHESSGESSDTIIFDRHTHSLRSPSQSSKNINDSLYKSVMTPSRRQGRKKLKEGTSFLYRTPFIKSKKKDYNIGSGKRIPRAYEVTWKTQVQDIMRKYWKISYLSSMFGFHYSKRNLKSSYLRALKIKILDVYPSYKLTVTITPSSFIHQNIKRTDSLFIVVNSLFIFEETEEERLSTVYEALLIRSKNHQSLPLQATDWFPLMLYRGNESIHNAVVRWLQASFGCYITTKGLQMSSLLWLTASWNYGICSNPTHVRRQDRVVIFRYEARSPNLKGVPLSSNSLLLKLSLKVDTIFELWQRITGNDKQELNLNHVTRFHLALEGLVENITKIPKALLSLVEVQTACNTISKTGKIRLSCDKSFTSLFQHLIELFEGICHFNHIVEGEEEDVGEENEQ